MRADRPTLPRPSAWLLSRALPAAYRAEMLADIEEAFVHDVRAVGPWRARWHLRAELFAILAMHRRHLAVGRAASSSLPERSPQRKMPMDSLAQDARFALRRLRAQWGATAMVVALLALGIGATSTLYTVLDAIFLQPVPYPAADRLAAIGTTFGPEHDRLASMSWPNFDDLAASTRSFDALGAALPLSLVATGADGAVKMAAAAASPQLLDMLGATPALGRMPSAAEWRGDEPAVALLGHGAWLRLFGGPTDLAGLRIDTTDGESYPVVGILPRDFVAPEAAGVGSTDVWLPAALVLDQLGDRGARVLGVIGRLADGVGLPAARAELDTLAARLASEYPADNAPGEYPFGIGVRDLTRETAGDFGTSYRIPAVAVAALLLITLVNVASLLIAQGLRRAPEIALRGALGAGRWRIVRQLLVESTLLALLGGIAGIAGARIGTTAFIAAYPGALPRTAEIGLDARAVGFALLLSLATGIACGMIPALRLARPAGGAARAIRPSAVDNPGGRRFSAALVVVEIALALVLFTAAGLLVNSFVRLRSVDPGFDADGLMVMRLDPGAAGADLAAQRRYTAEVLDAVRALPQVEAAATVVNLPLQRLNWRPGISFEDGTRSDTGINGRVVSDGYFDTLRVPLLSGRDFGAGDDLQAPPVVIVNQAFVERWLPDGDPVGRGITFNRPFVGEPFAHTVIGVVADMKEGFAADPAPELYVPLAQNGWPNVKVAYRPRAAAQSATVRAVVAQVDPAVPIDWHRALSEELGSAIGQQRFLAELVSLFAALAVLLAGAGIYALVAHGVQGRRREIGVRMAIGARAGEVVGMVLRQSLRRTLVGITVGLVGAAWVSRLLAGELYEIGTLDVTTYVAVALAFTVIATLAALLPALRAARVDPARVLRAD